MRQQTQNTQAQAHLSMACDELDLSWQWDPATYGSGREGLRAYLEKEHPHLLRAYDADFLLQAVEHTRARIESTR
jgi:hypothetical protein